MRRIPAKLSTRSRLALLTLAAYEVTHALSRSDATALAARDANVSEWYLRYTLLQMPDGKRLYELEAERLRQAQQEADDAA